MHVNLENSRAYGIRQHQSRYSCVRKVLTGVWVVPSEGSTFQFLDPGGVDRTVFLPPYSREGGAEYWIVNKGLGILNVVDSNGIAVVSVFPKGAACFIEGTNEWAVSGGFGASLGSDSVQVVTAAGTTVVASYTKMLIFNKSVATVSLCSLPSVLGRNLVSLEVYDFSGLAGDITLTPFGTEKIMGANSPWVIGSGGVAQSGGAAVLVPVVSLLGWVVR